MHVYGCAHVSHGRIRRALVFVWFIQIQPGLAWLNKNMPQKNWIQIDEKICHDYIPRDNFPKCFIEARPEVHHNTTRAHTSLCPVQTNVLLRQQAAGRSSTNLPYHYIICASIILPPLSLYLRRVWMIRKRYMRKHVVHVPMSRNVTTVWMLTWILNLSL